MHKDEVYEDLRYVYDTANPDTERLNTALRLIAHYRIKEYRVSKAIENIQDELSCFNA
jgi:hypothetical protein